ncbi:hypothetical protein U1Q18_033021, partial [Sarracenia purpurea var. burkii]
PDEYKLPRRPNRASDLHILPHFPLLISESEFRKKESDNVEALCKAAKAHWCAVAMDTVVDRLLR